MTNGANLIRMFVHQYRWVYPAMAAYLGMMAAVAKLGSKGVAPVMIFILCLPFFIGLIATTAAFANPNSDLASETSGYPPFLLRLPIRTSALALWPMLAGLGWAIFCWLGVSTLYFLPLEIPFDRVTPPFGIAALVLSIQALLWMPLRNGRTRLVAGLLVPAGLIVATVWMASAKWTSWQIAAVYGVTALGAGALAVSAVYRARTVGALRPLREPRSVIRDREAVRTPFASAYRAQLWLEWKRQGRNLPILTGVALATLSVPLFGENERYPAWINGTQVMMNTWSWPMLPLLPWVPLLFATIIGLGARRADLRTDDGVYHLFFATRPMDSTTMLRAKNAAITRGVLLAWGMTLLTGFLWLCKSANDESVTQPAWRFVIERSTGRDLLAGVVLLAIAIAWTWRNQMVGAFVDYLPSRWVSRLYPLLVVTIGAAILVFLSVGNGMLQRNDNLWAYLTPLGALLLLKGGYALTLGGRLYRERPAERGFILRSLALWPAYAVAAGSLLAWEMNYFLRNLPSKPALYATPVIFLFGVLLVPLARPLTARYALERGRHR